MSPIEDTKTYDADEHEFTVGMAFEPAHHWNVAIEVGYSWVPNDNAGTVGVVSANTGYVFTEYFTSGLSLTHKFNDDLDVTISEWVNLLSFKEIFEVEGLHLDGQFNFGFVNEDDTGNHNDYTFLVTGFDLKYEINQNLEAHAGPRYSWNNDGSLNNIEGDENHLWLGFGITGKF